MMMGFVNFLANGIPDKELDGTLSSLMQKIDGIVDDVLLIIYIALGLFLVVKGAILGMQIVKAADEPQVRQEKIGSLKWLVIGVAIAYGVAIVADIVIGYFADMSVETTSTITGSGS